ncbi:MAG TPA: DUF4301 family protein [Taishania sp.]|nr:DUF4301 family protein [Taishania sp.]
MNNEQTIIDQLDKIKSNQTNVVLFSPCRIGEGILQLGNLERDNLIFKFKKGHYSQTYFIPASGSGSRMFAFLFDYFNQQEASDFGSIERFMNHIQEFAFYHTLPLEIRERIASDTISIEELITYLLGEEGLNFASLPKGLVPFHYLEPFVLNPFQEHILQGDKLSNGKVKFHFTIQPEFEKKIAESIKSLELLTAKKYDVSFSVQSKESDSYAFTKDGELAMDNGEVIRRPAGHGALLENLNQIDSDIVFIRNIDNIQHFDNSQQSADAWAILGGMLQDFRQKMNVVAAKPTKDYLVELNQQYQFLSPSEINAIKTEADILKIINRPIRVCGMVRNEGQPGGGPFWIDDNGVITKQIVEKAQISMQPDQFKLMIKSTHFNPVMMALCPKDLNGNKLDLNDYKDESKYFVVNKQHKGQDIQYIELPGLWNGSMANWNTLFVEISQSTFSPVKTILDLLVDDHKGKK